MYIDRVPNRNSPPCILLRQCRREGGKVVKETLANMTKWPEHVVRAIEQALKGRQPISPKDFFCIERSLPMGHVELVLSMMRRLKLDRLIASKRCRQRDLILALIAERLLHPCSKLAAVRLWKETTLAQTLNVEDANVNEVYDAMKWLLRRQHSIERKLADRHLKDGAQVLYDSSSSYYWGKTCPLVFFGYNRDKKKGLPQIVYGLMTDDKGRPIAVQVYSGNTGDPSTVPDQIEKIRQRFELKRTVIVGDRGMLTHAQIETIRQHPELGWISALRNDDIQQLARQDSIQLTLFDEQNLAEITSPMFPEERLVVCRNPLLVDERGRKRSELLEATEKELKRIQAEVGRRTKKLLSAAEIALKVGKRIGKYKMMKHFAVEIQDNHLSWSRKKESIEQEQALDGVYVIRTSEPETSLSAQQVVSTYKKLAHVERAFRTMKGIEIMVRPIRHRIEETVRAHVFLCMLVYYVEWHLRRALASALFDDEELETMCRTRDPVLKAQTSTSAKRKKNIRKTEEGFEVQSLDTLIQVMAAQTKNLCRFHENDTPVWIDAQPTLYQSHIFNLVEMYPLQGT